MEEKSETMLDLFSSHIAFLPMVSCHCFFYTQREELDSSAKCKLLGLGLGIVICDCELHIENVPSFGNEWPVVILMETTGETI